MWRDRLCDLALLAAFTLGLWVPLGRRILKCLGAGALPATHSLSVALGMGVWGFWILTLGLFGLLNRTALLLSMVALLPFFRPKDFLPLKASIPYARHNLPELLMMALMCGLSLYYGALVLASSLAPETAFDSLNVHLPYARDAAASHRVAFVPNNWSSVMPALPLMSYITAFLFSGVTLAKSFNVVCYAACGGVIYAFACRWWDRKRAVAAALLLWSCPVALYEATTAMIDLPLALFSAVAVFALLEWAVCGEIAFFWLSAASLGLALGCKYHAAFWIVPILLVITWHSLRVLHCGALRLASLLFRYCLIAGALFLPWLIRAWLCTGNPVFPVANGIFKSPHFPPAMQEAARAAYASEGVGTGLRALLLLPWSATFHPGPFRGTLGFVFFFGVLLVLLRRNAIQIHYGLFIAGVYFYAWALTAQEIRYLLPLVPLLSVISAVGFLGSGGETRAEQSAGGSPKSPVVKEFGGYIGSLVLLFGAALAVPAWYPTWIKDWTYWHSWQSPLPYLLGRQTAQEYLLRDVPSIYVYEFINANLGRNNRILLLNDASQFYSKVPTLYSFTVEGEEILSQLTETGVLRRLKEYGISHVLLNYNGIAPIPGVAPRRGVYFFLDRGFQELYLEPIFVRNNVFLYRVRYG